MNTVDPMHISISRRAYRKLLLYPKLVQSEIGGLHRLIQNGDGGLHITDTILLKQEVTGAHVDLDMDALAAFVAEVDDPSEYRSWWH